MGTSDYARRLRARRNGPAPIKEHLILPEKPETYTFEIDHSDESLEHTLKTLTTASVRLLGFLGMPDQVKYSFRNNPQTGTDLDPSQFYIAAHRIETVEGSAYQFSTCVESSNHMVDTAEYELWRPERPGYMIPWGIHVENLSRTAHPHRRRSKFAKNDQRLQVRAPLNGIAEVYKDMVRGVYDQHLYYDELAPPDIHPSIED